MGPMRFPTNKAQSTLEAALLITLLIGAGLIGFEYAKESEFAFFKNLEEGIKQSEEENFQPSDPDDTRPPGCDPGDWKPHECGDGTNGCNYGERIWRTEYSCPGEPDFQCRVDNTCCTDWQLICNPPTDVSCCGINNNPPCPDGRQYHRKKLF